MADQVGVDTTMAPPATVRPGGGGFRSENGRGGRVYELDLLRLVAAASVMCFHLTFSNNALHLNPVRYPDAVRAFSQYGFLGVQLFFVISGIVILKSATGGSARRFAVSRAVRLYPAYWACVTITFFSILWFGTRQLGILDYVVNLTMLQTFLARPLVDGVYWTLAVELVFYGIVWLTLISGQIHRVATVLGVWMALSAVPTVAEALGAQVPWWVVIPLGYAAYFVVGATTTLMIRGQRNRATTALFVVSCGLALVRAVSDVRSARDYFGDNGIEVGLGVALVAAMMAVGILVAAGRFARFGRPWMAVVGVLTYPLYLLHDELSNLLFSHWQSLNRWILLLVVAAVIVAGACMVHVLVERPCAPMLRRVLDRAFAFTVAGEARSDRGPVSHT